MEFIDVITKRYSVRGYLDKEIEPEKLEYVLKAATLAPTGVNYQPFKVYVIDTKKYKDELSEIYLELEASGVHNVNLVTASHYTEKVAESIKLAKLRGCKLPFLWNSSGYDHVETLKKLDGLVDIYLPDMKYFSSKISKKYSNCADYFERTASAIAEMKRQTGTPLVKNGLLRYGTVVRHLVLPSYTEDSKKIIEYLYSTYGDSIYISIMSQYVPLGNVPEEINRRITEEEYNDVVDYAKKLGVTNAFLQERESATESFIPEFYGADQK